MTAVAGSGSSLGWSVDPVLIFSAAFVAVAYRIRARNLAREGRPVALGRQLCFATGLVIIVLALVSPIDTIGENRLCYVHKIQHLMLGDLGPLFLVLGVTGPILRPVLVLSPVRALRPLAHPLIALPLWVIVISMWHLPALYQAALDSDAVHALEHLSFFAAGLAMWAAVIEPLPGPSWFGTGPKAIYVLLVRVPGAILGNIFIGAGQPLYPDYASGERAAGITPVTDQTIAGAIMFTEGAIVTLVVFAWLFLRWTREAELQQTLLDRGHDARAATRAARYGRRRLLDREGPPPSPRARPAPDLHRSAPPP
jgi:cytochrome c oxidase assembly factor CtaG